MSGRKKVGREGEREGGSEKGREEGRNREEEKTSYMIYSTFTSGLGEQT